MRPSTRPTPRCSRGSLADGQVVRPDAGPHGRGAGVRRGAARALHHRRASCVGETETAGLRPMGQRARAGRDPGREAEIRAARVPGDRQRSRCWTCSHGCTRRWPRRRTCSTRRSQRRRRRPSGGDAAQLVRHRAAAAGEALVYYRDQVNPTVANLGDGAARRRARRGRQGARTAHVLTFGSGRRVLRARAGSIRETVASNPVVRRLRRAAPPAGARLRHDEVPNSLVPLVRARPPLGVPTPMTDSIVDLARRDAAHRLPAGAAAP